MAAFSVAAVTVPALKLPEASRFTIAFAVFALVGATAQAMFSVPVVVTGDPLTVKSDAGAVSPTLFTVPGPVPGNVCPTANVNRPLLLIFSPVSVGTAAPVPYSRFSVPDAVAVLFPAGSACNWNVCGTAVTVPLLKADATKFSGREFLPVSAVATPVAGRFNLPATFTAVVPVWVMIEFWMLVAVVNNGIAFTVPPVVVTFDVVGGGAEALAGAPFAAPVAVVAEAALFGATASTNAEGGSPPTVSASAAFMA